MRPHGLDVVSHLSAGRGRSVSLRIRGSFRINERIHVDFQHLQEQWAAEIRVRRLAQRIEPLPPPGREIDAAARPSQLLLHVLGSILKVLVQQSTNGGEVRSMWFALSSSSVMHAFEFSATSELRHDTCETPLGFFCCFNQQSPIVVDSAAQADHARDPESSWMVRPVNKHRSRHLARNSSSRRPIQFSRSCKRMSTRSNTSISENSRWAASHMAIAEACNSGGVPHRVVDVDADPHHHQLFLFGRQLDQDAASLALPNVNIVRPFQLDRRLSKKVLDRFANGKSHCERRLWPISWRELHLIGLDQQRKRQGTLFGPPLVRSPPATFLLRFCQNQQGCVDVCFAGEFQRAVVGRIDQAMKLDLLHERRFDDLM